MHVSLLVLPTCFTVQKMKENPVRFFFPILLQCAFYLVFFLLVNLMPIWQCECESIDVNECVQSVTGDRIRKNKLYRSLISYPSSFSSLSLLSMNLCVLELETTGQHISYLFIMRLNKSLCWWSINSFVVIRCILFQ